MVRVIFWSAGAASGTPVDGAGKPNPAPPSAPRPPSFWVILIPLPCFLRFR